METKNETKLAILAAGFLEIDAREIVSLLKGEVPFSSLSEFERVQKLDKKLRAIRAQAEFILGLKDCGVQS